ncbi:MAG: inovirus Gp2 family protein [Flavobacteriales bacterium]
MSVHRHPDNHNLTVYSNEAVWQGHPVLPNQSGFVIEYLTRIQQTLDRALAEYKRLSVMRFDLRFPQNLPCRDDQAISRFVEALKAKIRADQHRKGTQGKRVYPCNLRYVWVKEQAGSEACHYHVAIVLNHDAYFTLGNYTAAPCTADPDMPVDHRYEPPENMAERIISAWAGALGLSIEHTVGQVHFPDNPVYSINRNAEAFPQQYNDVFQRLSYFAKVETKQYGDHSRHFSCSRA